MPNTKRHTFLFRAVAVLAGITLISVGLSAFAGRRLQSTPSFSLEILPSQNAIYPGVGTWKIGTPVFVIVKMTNTSQHILHFALTNPAFDYRISVLDSSGKPVGETEHFRKIRAQGGSIYGRFILGVLKPQETCQDTVEVSYLYDLAKTGDYTVQIERDLGGEGIAKSNTLKVTVE